MSEKKPVPVVVIFDGVREVHIPSATGDYLTVCGLDGGDEDVGQRCGELKPGDAISCKDCLKIMEMARKKWPIQ